MGDHSSSLTSVFTCRILVTPITPAVAGPNHNDIHPKNKRRSHPRDTMPTARNLSGVYNVKERRGTGEAFPDRPESLFITEDEGSLWGYFELDSLKGMFWAKNRPRRTPSGNIGTFCRCRVDGEDGETRVYDGAWPAPSQYVNFPRDDWLEGMVLYGRGREDCRRIEAHQVGEGGTKSEIGADKMREMWKKMASEDH